MDSTCGSGTFWNLFNEKVLRNIPAEDLKNIAKATASTAATVAQKASAALQEKKE